MSRVIVPALCLAAALAAQPKLTFADGVNVKTWIKLPKLLKESRLIIVGKVLETKHVKIKVEGRGAPYLHISRLRALLQIDRVLKGKRSLRGRRVWVEKNALFRPGRWIAVKKAYRSGLHFTDVKAGVRLAAFAFDRSAWVESRDGKPPRFEAFAIERAKKLKR